MLKNIDESKGGHRNKNQNENRDRNQIKRE